MARLLWTSLLVWIIALPILFFLLLASEPSHYVGKHVGYRDELYSNYKRLPGPFSSIELRFYNSSKIFGKKYLPLLKELGLAGNADYIDLKTKIPNVTLVSGISENHAGEGRSMVARLAKDHPGWKLVLYDMGLKPKTRQWFKAACNVEVRNINLTHFGVANNLFTYRFKAVIIAYALLEFPAVFWIDSSTFLSPNMSLTKFVGKIEPSKQKGGPHAYLLGDTTGHSTFAVTAKGMYDYLSPQGNYFRSQGQGGRALYFRTRETYELALKWYVLCSLEADCMAPKGAQLKCKFKKGDAIKSYANCHRYDQSAINLILLPYETSFLGNWTVNQIWTLRGKQRDTSALICKRKEKNKT